MSHTPKNPTFNFSANQTLSSQTLSEEVAADLRDCRMAFMKHVLPRLRRPAVRTAHVWPFWDREKKINRILYNQEINRTAFQMQIMIQITH